MSNTEGKKMNTLTQILANEINELDRLKGRHDTFEQQYQSAVIFIEDIRIAMDKNSSKESAKEYNELARALKNARKEKKFNKRKVWRYSYLIAVQNARVDELDKAIRCLEKAKDCLKEEKKMTMQELEEIYKTSLIEEKQARDMYYQINTDEDFDEDYDNDFDEDFDEDLKAMRYSTYIRKINYANYIVALYEKCLPEIIDLINLFEGQELNKVYLDIEARIVSILQKYNLDFVCCRIIYDSYLTRSVIRLENSKEAFSFTISHKSELGMFKEGKIFRRVDNKGFSVNLKYIENPAEFIDNTLTILKEIDSLKDELNTKIKEYKDKVEMTIDGTFPRRYTVDALYD